MDYYFYRLYLWYKNNRISKSKIPKFSAIICISVFTGLLLFDALLVLHFTNKLSVSDFVNKQKGEFWALGIYFALILLLYLRYGPKEKFETIMNKFESHKLNDKIKNWQVPLIPVVIWVSITFCIFYFLG